MRARPSTSAVLPTPASPTYSGLFLRRRHRISTVRSISTRRPISGSIRPSIASLFRLVVNFSSAVPPSGSPRSPSVPGAGSSLVRTVFGDLRQAVRDVVDDVEPRDVLHRQQVGGVRVLLAEDRDQHVRRRDFLLAARLHVEHGALQHALEAQRRLHFAVVVVLEPRRGLVDEVLQVLAQAGDVGAAGAQDLAHLGRVHDGEQQVLDRHEFVARLARRLERFVQTDFEFAA